MLKKILKIFAVVLVVFVAFALFAFSSLSIPQKSTFAVDWQEVRALASEGDQALPTGLNALLTAWNKTLRVVVVAGTGFGEHELPTYAYQIVYPDQTIVIDPVVDHQTAVDIFPTAKGFPQAFAQMQSAMRTASIIAMTHEHFDHASGIPSSPYLDEIVPRVVMTREQLTNDREMKQSRFSPELLARLKPLDYDKYHRLAPGVVLIKTGGHTLGSQMIFINLADGREVLLVGDLAWHGDNIALPKGHPRLVHWIGGEDGQRMAHLLRFLHDLKQSQPQLNQVVAHDGDQMAAYVKAGLIGSSFQLSQ